MTAEYRSSPFVKIGTGERILIHRPFVEVRVVGPKGVELVRSRLDTGADETLLPWSSIGPLGVQLIAGSALEIQGIGGSERVMFGLVDLEFQDPNGTVRWSHHAAFSPSNKSLFGLSGFLEYFVVRLDGVKHEIGIKYRGKAPAPRFLPPTPRRSR